MQREAIEAAVRAATRVRLEYWADVFDTHRGHKDFHVTLAFDTNTIMMTCGCGEVPPYHTVFYCLARQYPAVEAEVQATLRRLATRHQTRPQQKRAHPENRRAAQLLYRHLTGVQKSELRHSGCFHVVGADGYFYRIERACHGNVVRETPTGEARFCATVPGVPTEDVLLLQKLTLEADPSKFFAVANGPHRPRPATPVRGRVAVERRRAFVARDLDDPLVWAQGYLRGAGGTG